MSLSKILDLDTLALTWYSYLETSDSYKKEFL